MNCVYIRVIQIYHTDVNNLPAPKKRHLLRAPVKNITMAPFPTTGKCVRHEGGGGGATSLLQFAAQL